MTLMIDLSPEVGQRLRERAAENGVEPAQLAASLVDESLTVAGCGTARVAADAVAELFTRWEAEDPVTGPADLEQRQRELDDFKAGMNAASTRGHPIYP